MAKKQPKTRFGFRYKWHIIIFITSLLFYNTAAASQATGIKSIQVEVIKETYKLRSIKPIHYDVEVKLNNTEQTVWISTNLTFESERKNLKEIIIFLNSGFHIKQVFLDDNLTKFRVKRFIPYYPYNVIRVLLNNPINKNEKHKLTIIYNGKFAERGRLSTNIFIDGTRSEFPALSLWHPRVFPKEFFTAKIKISLSLPHLALCSGDLVNVIRDKGSATYTFNTNTPVDELAFYTGEFYKKTKMQKDTKIELYYTEEIKSAEKILNYCIEIISYYKKLLRLDSIKNLKVLLSPRERQEVNYKSSDIIVFHLPLSFIKVPLILFRILSHEIAHHVFLSTSGTNFLDDNCFWFREGIAEYLAMLSTTEILLKDKISPSLYFKSYLSDYSNLLKTLDTGEKPLLDIFPVDMNFYLKGAFIFRMLHYITGPYFFKIIKEYIDRYKYEFPNFNDFKKVIGETYGEDLTWFFDPFVKTTKKIDVGIEDVDITQKNSSYYGAITIRNYGQIFANLKAKIIIETLYKKYPKEFNLKNKAETIELKTDDKIVSVEIDPDHWLLDVNLENNYWSIESTFYRDGILSMKNCQYDIALYNFKKAVELNKNILKNLEYLYLLKQAYELNKKGKDFLNICHEFLRRYRKDKEIERNINMIIEEIKAYQQKKYIKNWLIMGPFSDEKSINLDEVLKEEIDPDKTYESEGKTIRWISPYEENSYGVVDLKYLFKQNEEVFALAGTYIYSPSKRKVKFLVGSDDGIEIFVNNEKIMEKNIIRGFVMDEDTVSVNLIQGWNKVFIKIYNKKGEWKFSFRICGEEDKPIKDLIFSTLKRGR